MSPAYRNPLSYQPNRYAWRPVIRASTPCRVVSTVHYCALVRCAPTRWTRPKLRGMSEDSSALLTDHYELTMLQGALHSGAAARRSVFEMFARRLPEGRRYGVVAGTGRFLELLERFRFGSQELDFLSDHQIVDERTLEWLSKFRFSGNIWGYGEGEVYFPGSPIMVVESTFAEAVVLETLALSVFNHDSAI